jgi:hypothetical protein
MTPLQVMISALVKYQGLESTIEILQKIPVFEANLRLFACDCTERVLPLVEDRLIQKTLVGALLVNARDYAHGKTQREELEVMNGAVSYGDVNRDLGAAWTILAVKRSAQGNAPDAAQCALGVFRVECGERTMSLESLKQRDMLIERFGGVHAIL